MTYNSNDFLIFPNGKGIGSNYYRATIVGHNTSSIGLKKVSVSYYILDKNGVTRHKSTCDTHDISPGEKREILNEEVSYVIGHRRLQVTDITVKASDGTVFKVPALPEFNPISPEWGSLLFLIAVLFFGFISLKWIVS